MPRTPTKLADRHVTFFGFLPSCRDTARLLSQAADGPLPFWKWVRMQAHLLTCSFCRRYARQMRLIRQVLRRLGGETAPESPPGMPAAVRERLKRRLSEEGRG